MRLKSPDGGTDVETGGRLVGALTFRDVGIVPSFPPSLGLVAAPSLEDELRCGVCSVPFSVF